jgi:hypothetical protein
VFQEILEKGKNGEGMPAIMRTSVVSLIFKNKGQRWDLGKYRPIAVNSIIYRVLAKTMVVAIRPILPTITSAGQKAFKEHELISDNTRQVANVMHWCNTTQRGGMLLFADQDNAYPRVQWDYMFATMRTMNLHLDFITMVKTLYTDTNLRFKVNGVVDPHTTQPKNGIAQGCPLSPQLYLMCIQGLLSLMNRDAQQPGGLQGIEVPDERGNITSAPQFHFSAFADDVCLFLRDEDQLPRFKHLLGIYEIGAGALNSWEKRSECELARSEQAHISPQEGSREGT